MKSVAFLKRDFHSLGGLEKVSKNIIDAFQSKGAEVTLLTAAQPKANCRVESCQLKSRISYRRIREFDRWCRTKSTGSDIVFSMDRSSFQTHHRAGNGVHAAYLDLRKKKEGRFKSLSFAFNPLHRTLLKLEKATFEDPSLQGLIVNSYFVKEQIVKYYKTAPEIIHVVHNGVEWYEMEDDFKASFPHKSSPFEILFIGHNFERKGLGPLLHALSRLKENDFHLSIVGDDKHRSYFQKLAIRLAVPATFWGPQDNPRPFYQKADAVAIPSLYDPFANVTVEALAMGLFVISSKTNGGFEALTPETGIAVDDDLDAWVAALTTAFNHPKTLPSAEKIRQSVRHLDLSNQMEKICQICLS